MVDTVETDELGFKTISVDDESEIESIYQDLENNKYNLHINQYIIFEHSTKTDKHNHPITLDCLKWTGNHFERINSKGFTTESFGKFKPYDYYQKAAIDSIVNNDLTCIRGHAGSGKSLLSLQVTWHLMERGQIDRLIVFTNPVKTKDAEALGFYKGDRTEKLLDSQIGILLISKFGSKERVEELIHDGIITLLPFSDMRGFDTSSEQKTMVWCTESQNLNKDLLKLGIQRMGFNTKGIIEGDPTAQVDKESYRKSNGMNRMSEVFNGDYRYGEIELKNIYRSWMAEKAQEM